MLIATIFLVAMFLCYNYMVFELVDAFLKKPRLKKLSRIPVAILNTVIAAFLTLLSASTTFSVYVIIGVILFIEFVIFYKDKPSRALFCMLACIIHVMVLRAVCVSIFALTMQRTLYEVVADPFTLVLSTGVTFAFLNIAILLVIRFIPAKGVRIINQHKEQLQFMTACLVVFCAYMLINSTVYSTPSSYPTLLANQLAVSLTLLVGTYIVLFFSIRTSTLLGHKELNEELQQTVEKERQYRASVDRDVFRIIEVNFSKNEIVSGFEDDEQQLSNAVHDYSEMLAFMIQTSVHPDDVPEFERYSSPLTVIEEFENGTIEISFDYRHLVSDGSYRWMRLLMPLMRDEKTGEIQGFVQIRDIDAEKRQQLELQYKAERDSLTGLYNRGTTEKLIAEYLSAKNTTMPTGVLFVIDIDNFKDINDHIGHLYGDAVLSELSESLRMIFREHDIVGRIGGDEFLVFAKGTLGKPLIAQKANAICTAFLRTYTNNRNEGYTVSSSIGIALCPQDGTTFESLFKRADAALYTAKATGKNTHSFYEQDQELSYISSRTEIDSHGTVQKNFRDNRVEYVFRMLYGSSDTKFAIESVLELIAKNFGFSRANIFEFNELSTHFTGVFEWCASGIESVGHKYIDMPVSSFAFVVSALEKSGGMFMATPTDFPDYAQESYTSIGIKSIVHFSIKEGDKLIGVVAFQNCTDDHFALSEAVLDELRTICQVLSVFMAKQLSSEREQRHHLAIEAVMDNMNSIAYVVDRENFDVFYENQNVVHVTGHSSIGMKCYKAYRGFDAQCDDCPLRQLSEENPRCTLELYTERYNIYTKTSASLIEWSNDRPAMLISSVDITEYKTPDN